MANATPCTSCGKKMRNSTAATPMCHPCRRVQPKKKNDIPGWDCVVCGVYVKRTKGPVGMYCAKHKNTRGGRSYARACKGCGNTFHTSWNKKKYCDPDCRPAPKPKPDPTFSVLRWRQCIHPHCEAWICKRGGSKYCTKQCAHDAAMLNLGCRNRTCRDCDKPLGYISRVTLCDACRRRNKNANKHYRARARKYGVLYESVNKYRVYDRDGWVCGLCRKKVDPKYKYPHLMSASLDHVEPMSLGGGHLYVNCQIAHLKCNRDKSNTGYGDQLALVG